MTTAAAKTRRAFEKVQHCFFTMKIARMDAPRIVDDMKKSGVRIEKVDYQPNGTAIVYFA